MEVVQEGAMTGSNVEYEMMQDAATTTSSTMNEDQPMDYALPSSSSHTHDEDYEVMMEEYGEEGAGSIEEGEMVDVPIATMGDEEQVLEEMVDEEHSEGNHVEEIVNPDDEKGKEKDLNTMTNTDKETYEGEVTGDEAAELHRSDAEGSKEEGAELIVQKEGRDGYEQNEVAENEGETTYVASKDPQEQSASTDPTKGEEIAAMHYKDSLVLDKPVESQYDEPASNVSGHMEGREDAEDRKADGKSAQEVGLEEEEGEEEDVHAPPPVRVTFNGQDFVLFSLSEPSTYIPVQQEEPVAAPQLKSESRIFYETLDSLFESLRVKDSLGDFLEEGSELQVNFVDLEMTLREVSAG